MEEGLVTQAMAGVLGPGNAPRPVGLNKNYRYRLRSRCPAAPRGAVVAARHLCQQLGSGMELGGCALELDISYYLKCPWE